MSSDDTKKDDAETGALGADHRPTGSDDRVDGTDDQAPVGDDGMRPTDDDGIGRGHGGDGDRTPPPAQTSGGKSGGGGFFSAFLGALIAVAIGFGVAQFTGVIDLFGDRYNPVQRAVEQQSDQIDSIQTRLDDIANAVSSQNNGNLDSQMAEMTSQIEGLAGQIDSVTASLSNVQGGVQEGVSGVQQQIGGVESQLGAVADQLSGLNERLTAVEQRPLQESSETARQAYEAYEQQVDRLRAELEDLQVTNQNLTQEMQETAQVAEEQVQEATQAAQQQQQQAEQRAQQAEEQAQADARAAEISQALNALTRSIENGSPFQSAVETLSQATDVPQALQDAAADGVATLTALRQTFDAAARDALAASIRTNVSENPIDRLGAFLRTQTGARSLTPREGNGPDAILSRAQSALEEGNVAEALSQISNLPQEGQDAMSDWVARAEQRVAVMDAAEQISQSIQAG